MGLSQARKRTKIGNDPNNETWARSTENYGHRMLVSQGWAPGGTLGSADNAAYSAHLTEGSRSHIRVKLREDNLGLGAKRGSGQEAGECVGLDAFQAMLGRLNGKSDEALEREQRSRDDLKRARYVELKGTVRFVRGGTLVHDMERLIELARRSRISLGLEKGDDKGEKEGEEEAGEEKMRRKQKKKEPRQKATVQEEEENEEEYEDTEAAAKLAKKEAKKRKHREAEASDDTPKTAAQPTTTTLSSNKASEADSSADASEDEKAAKARRKAARAERREQKRQRREERAARKTATGVVNATLIREEEADAEPVVQETLVVEPAAAEQTTQQQQQQQHQQAVSGRHMSVRSRYIAAKRRAVMDPQALKEILMVKA